METIALSLVAERTSEVWFYLKPQPAADDHRQVVEGEVQVQEVRVEAKRFLDSTTFTDGSFVHASLKKVCEGCGWCMHVTCLHVFSAKVMT